MRFKIDEIWLDNDASYFPLAERIIKSLPKTAVFREHEWKERSRLLLLKRDPIGAGKRVLRLMRHKGEFIKKCPGTPNYICCGLKILHIGQGCPIDCRYCALQTYFNRPVLEVFVNTEDLMKDLNSYLAEHPSVFHRFCTGEFTDSLALDPVTGLTPILIDFFSRQENASLEIKTKTDFIEPLLTLNPNGRIIVAFSVNSEAISRSEEIRAASIKKRIAAASLVRDHGYYLAFHFDPIIPLSEWEQHYFNVIDRIYEQVGFDGVAWISMGVLRFAPELKEVVTERFGPIDYFHEGFLRGLDGKRRLYVERRIEVYRKLSERILSYSPETRIYLCMESPFVWEHALGIRMNSDRQMSEYLDAAMIN